MPKHPLAVKNKAYSIALLAALVVAPVQATTPILSGVTGTVQTNQTLTITGTTMVDHDTSSWIQDADWNFEGASFADDGYAVPTNDNQGLCARTTTPPYAGITYSSSVKLLGSQSIQFHQSGAFSGPGVGGCYIYAYPDPLPGSDFYVSAYVRYDASAGDTEWPNNFIKLFLTVGGDNQFYFQPEPAISGAPTQMLMYENYTSTYGDIPGGAIKNNRWYYMEARYKNSSPKRYQAWVDGVQIGDWVPQGNVNSPPYFPFGMVNLSATSSNFDMTLNMDRYAISSARIYPAATIEIGNNATYGQGTKLWQEPIYLSDGSIQIKADLTGLGDGPYYLWVTNNKQERSLAYSLSGEGDASPPTTAISTSDPSAISADSLTATGTASDDTAVSGCKWRIGSAPDGSNGTGCTGTTSVSCATSGYASGANTLYVGCYDAAGNYGSDSITVDYTTSASSIWTESFNDSNFASRNWEDDYADVWVDTSTKQAGDASWRQTWNNGATNVRNSTNSGTVASIRKVIGNEDEIYLEWYWFLNSDYVGSGQAYHPHLIILTNSLWADLSAGDLGVYLELTGRELRFIVRRASSYEDWHDSGYTLPLSSWKKIGAYLKMNTVGQSDGVVRLYVDGEQVYAATDLAYRTSSSVYFNTIAIAPWIGDGSPAAQTMWMDELAVMDGLPTMNLTAPTGFEIITQ